jgi:5-dehydro-2-deoxygluconokinase
MARQTPNCEPETRNRKPETLYDSLHMGRSSIDLYSNDVGAPFTDIKSFAAYVGGSPTNISVGMRRLGGKPALLTALGQDPVGDFLLNFLEKEGVETKYILRKPGHRTSAVILGIEPPDKFPLVYYRDNCADIELTIDDVLAAPFAKSRVFQFAGTNLSREPSRSATLFGAEVARQAGTEVVFDIDFRPDQWHDPRAFGVTARCAFRLTDIAIGTEDEINAAMLTDPAQITLTHSQVSDTKVKGDTEEAIAKILALGPKAVIQKRGEQGARVHLCSQEIQNPRSPEHSSDKIQNSFDVPGFPVEIYNILGAGDAFGAGFLYGYVNGRGWYESCRIGNACGAIVVTKHGCANFMPTYKELMEFVKPYGGL